VLVVVRGNISGAWAGKDIGIGEKGIHGVGLP
jgi:hypothetical protein